MKQIAETIIFSIITYTFVGLCYPEYVLTPQTYCYVETNESRDEDKRDPDNENIALYDFYQILTAKSGSVVIKSRLLETLSETFNGKGKQVCQNPVKNQSQNKMSIKSMHQSECSTLE